MEPIEIFPVTVARFHYEKNSELQQIINTIISSAKVEEARELSSSTHYFEKSGNLLNNPLLADFKDFVMSSANQYVNNLLKIDSEMFVTLSWINHTNSGFDLDPHNHGNSYISGTYYLNFNPLYHSPITFHKSVLGQQFQYLDIKPSEFNKYNAKSCQLSNLIQGDLILWPSHLEHGYTANVGNDRVSISMNFLPKIVNNGDYKFYVSSEEPT
jgi:hypothetical protein